jgi:hypothetical protein
VRQLALFPGAVPEEPEAPVEEIPEPEEPGTFVWAEPSDVLPGQLNLFSDRAVRLGRARAAIGGADLASARGELAGRRAAGDEADFAGEPSVDNTTSVTVRLPRANLFAPAALCAMMARVGERLEP